MRRMAVVVATMVAGGALGVAGWQVAGAAPEPATSLTVCERPGADLRSPGASGTCPSGYTLKTIREVPPTPPPPPVVAHQASRSFEDYTSAGEGFAVVDLTVPPGDYEVHAHGNLDAGSTVGATAETRCIIHGPSSASLAIYTQLEEGPSSHVATGAGSVVLSLPAGGRIYVGCTLVAATVPNDVWTSWHLSATRVDAVDHQV